MTRPLALAALAVAVAAAGAAEITPLAGKPFKGTVVGIDAAAVTVTDAEGKEVKLPVKEVASVDFGGKAPVVAETPHDEIELVDGSVLRVGPGTFRLKADQGSVSPLPGTTPEAPAITLPQRTLYYLMRDAHKPANRDDWKKLLAGKGKRDLLVVRTAGGLDQIDGTVLDGNAEGTRLNFEQATGEKASFPLARFSGGLVFNQPPRAEIPPTLCRVVDAFGNVLIAAAVKLEKGGMVVITVGGATVSYPTVAGVSLLDFRQGNVKYLGDFEPVVTAPKPVENSPNFTYLRDKRAGGTPLTLAGTTYAKGLWVSHDVTLAFPLNGEYKTFKAMVGKDDEAAKTTARSVRVIIEGDGRRLFNQMVAPTDKPRELTLDVKDVKELKIIVDPETTFDVNEVNLAEARVQK